MPEIKTPDWFPPGHSYEAFLKATIEAAKRHQNTANLTRKGDEDNGDG